MIFLAQHKLWNGRDIRSIEFYLAIVGLVIAAYLTIYHYSASVPLACPDSGTVDCAYVLTSSFSMLFGIPIALYGLAFFAMEILLILFDWKWDLLYLNALGITFVVYLLYAEYELGKICIYCTAVHILVISLLILSALNLRRK
ncbi:MAG: vitamin K epoxide reductase family protein [Candidatus Micrarchaeia archaeon]